MVESLKEHVPTPLELRAELLDMVRRDLLGPAGGPEEEIDERAVRGRYILGLLAPRGQALDPSQLDDLALGSGKDGQDGTPDNVVPQTASFLPSSMGLSFSVDGAADTIQITASWGQYYRTESDYLSTEGGKAKLVWKRKPIKGVSKPVVLKRGKIDPWQPDPENKGVYVTGLCRWRDGTWSVTLFLVNAQEEPKQLRDTAWVFQPELTVTAPDMGPIFVKRPLPIETNQDSLEDLGLNILYRRQVEFAVGHGVATTVDLAEGMWERAYRISTSISPKYEVERMESPSLEDLPDLANLVLDMKELSETEMGDFAPSLMSLVDSYQIWIKEQEDKLISPTADLAPYVENARHNLSYCHEAIGRLRAGIHLLDNDAQAAQAFQFANKSMHQQRIRSVYAEQVRRGQKPDLEDIDQPENRSWRPFQLAFVLLSLPALADPTHDERNQISDLLWFPTGGGKTEAYLGVAAFAIGIRRLQGEMDGLSGLAGVTVLMRYTLRLLTLQQFQRAATLIAACELIRRDKPKIWGNEPFRIGLWVGVGSTPNWTSQSDEAIKQEKGNLWTGGFGGTGTPAQLTNCPWCGKPIDAGKNIRVETYENGRGRTFQYCSDRLGRCPFSSKQSPDEGLPVVVVDEEIYRRLPTLLIATVDKFAQMPWKGATQMLFGRVTGHCPRHGYRSPDIKDSDSHPPLKRAGLPGCKTQEIGRLRPPDLIIQDELHLISGPLGTLVGLYETAIDRLCEWDLDGQKVRPKIIASTATIRRASEQVNSLFLRNVRIFPPSAVDAEDNFFSARKPSSNEAPGRLYLGVCAPGVRLKAALIRVYVAFMAAAQVLYEQYGQEADPWMTLVGYFNSMRELGGMRRVADDAVRTRLTKMDARGLAKRFINPMDIEELTSRKGATDIPRILDRLERPFTPETVGTQGKGKSKPVKPVKALNPFDIVLATNMISVGVDVARLGLMVTAGQPKATAEYIQATSRVGRRFPGIVCTVYNWARPRDLSHYERFEHYHATFYQHVEALSVTPFAPRALDRGLTAVMVSLIRLFGQEYNANVRAGDLVQSHPYIDEAIDEIGNRAGRVRADESLQEDVKLRIKERVDQWLARIDDLEGSILAYQSTKDGRTVDLLFKPAEKDWDRFTCLNSLRDVEPNVFLVLNDYGMDREMEPSGSSPGEVTS